MKVTSQFLPRLAGLMALAALFLAPVRAVPVVTLSPSGQDVAVGGSAFVDLNISGLGDGVAPSLGGWLAHISFDSVIVSISAGGVVFGGDLDLGVFGSIQGSDLSTASLVQLDEVSFEDAADLNLAQPDSFTLATLEFVGFSPGTTTLSFARLELSDELGFPLSTTSQGATIRVTGGANRVPDGGAITLFGALCLGALCFAHARHGRTT